MSNLTADIQASILKAKNLCGCAYDSLNPQCSERNRF